MSPEAPWPATGLVTRRAVGKGAAALAVSTALVVAGCDTEDPLDLPGLPSLGRDEPDLEHVRTGLRDEQAVLAQVQRVRRRHRSLRSPLDRTLAVHRAHVQLLARAVDGGDATTPDVGGDGSPGRREGRVPRDPAAALTMLVRRERMLATQHVETAMRSRSGVLARAVAAMSAAAAQQAVVLASLDVKAGTR